MGSEPWNEDRDVALRALLVERARSGHALQEVRRTPARSEPRRLQAFIFTAVVLVAVVAGSTATVLLAQQRTPEPAGFAVTQPTAAATQELAPPTPPVPSSTPEEVLQTPAPTPTPEATESVPDPSQTSVPASDPASGTLIAPDGWTALTRAELHEFVVDRFSDDPDNAAIWEEQAWLDIQCMAEKGFLYDPIGDVRRGEHGLTAEERQNYEIAMYGPPTDQPYDWTTAGCHGRSVHETGQDHAN